jgi:hypothetical protein
MIKTVVFIPLRSNDGRPFPLQVWEELQRRLEQFGGYTRGARQQGYWHDGVRWYREPNVPYHVSLISARELPAWLAFVEWVQRAFDQEAMYIEIGGQPEVIDFRGAGL